MAGVIRDAKFHTNDGGNASARPERPPEAIDFGALLQQSGQAGKLRGGQPAAGTRRWSVPQSFRTTPAATRHPLTDGPFADPQGRGDLALRPTPLCEGPGLYTTGFFPVVQ